MVMVGGTADGSFTVGLCCSVSLQPLWEQVSKHKTQPVITGVKHTSTTDHQGATESSAEAHTVEECRHTSPEHHLLDFQYSSYLII